MTDEEKIIKALDTYFNRESPPKFINVSRIPLICQDISTIKETLLVMQKGIDKKEDDHEGRIRKIEGKQSFWSGGIAVIGIAGSLIGGLIVATFEWLLARHWG